MTRKDSHFKKRITLVFVVVLITLGSIEAVLQGMAYFAWMSYRHSEWEDAKGRSVILCTGDSFTFGLGAKEDNGSYPEQLERLLEAKMPGGYVVANRGWPSWDSRDVLAALPGYLEETKPKRVYILIGLNDSWSVPERLPEEGESTGASESFPFTWRTMRLVRLGWDRLGGGSDSDAGEAGDDRAERSPFIGQWTLGTLEAAFDAGGTLRLGDEKLRWEAQGVELVVLKEGKEYMRCEWSRQGDKIYLLDASGLSRYILEPVRSEPLGKQLTAAFAALKAADFSKAEKTFIDSLGETGDQQTARLGLVQTLCRAGRVDEARAHLQWLEANHATLGEPTSGEALLRAHMEMSDDEIMLEKACRLLEAHPFSQTPLEVFQQVKIQLDSRDRVVSSIEKACQKLSAHSPQQGLLLRLESNLFMRQNPETSLRCIARAFQADGDHRATVQQFSTASNHHDPKLLQRIFSKLCADGTASDTLERLFERALSSEERLVSTLRNHVKRIVKTCRAREAEPVLLLYPEKQGFVDTVVREVAVVLGVRLLDPQPLFEVLLRTDSRDRFFIQDGHCTREGYLKIAEFVARDVLEPGS